MGLKMAALLLHAERLDKMHEGVRTHIRLIYPPT